MRAILISPRASILGVDEVLISSRDPLRDIYCYLDTQQTRATSVSYLDSQRNPQYFDNVQMLVNAQANPYNYAMNQWASLLYGYQFHRGTICGPALLIGLRRGHGEWTDLPESWTESRLTSWIETGSEYDREKLAL